MTRHIPGIARTLLRGTMLELVELGAPRHSSRTPRLGRFHASGRLDSRLLPPIVR